MNNSERVTVRACVGTPGAKTGAKHEQKHRKIMSKVTIFMGGWRMRRWGFLAKVTKSLKFMGGFLTMGVCVFLLRYPLYCTSKSFVK